MLRSGRSLKTEARKHQASVTIAFLHIANMIQMWSCIQKFSHKNIRDLHNHMLAIMRHALRVNLHHRMRSAGGVQGENGSKSYRVIHVPNCQCQARSGLVCLRIMDEHSPHAVLQLEHAVLSVIERRLIEIACEQSVRRDVVRSGNVLPGGHMGAGSELEPRNERLYFEGTGDSCRLRGWK